MKTFQADSDYMGKINIKKKFQKKIFQCLALPKDRQSFCEVQKKCHQIFSKKKLIPYELSKCSRNAKIFKKFQLEVGIIVVTNMPLVLSMHRSSISLWSPKG